MENSDDMIPNRVALCVVLVLAACRLTAASANEQESDGSPRLIGLAHELRAGSRQALATFWKEMEGKAPLVESIGADQGHRRVTFIWRGSSETTRVTMMGGLPSANILKPLTRLPDTDLWYLTETHSTEERFKSQILNAEYSLSLYTPAGYEQNRRRCWLVIAFDGGFRRMDVTLDNLLAAGKIPPLVVAGVQNISSQTRMRDLDCSDEFASFLAKELVPWARKTYRVYNDPAHTIVGGMSLGGKMAT